MTAHDLINESHRAECNECRAEWTALEAIGAEARALPQLTPSRDLWAGISARLDAKAARPRWFARPMVRMAAAAALLVTATAAVTWRVATDRDTAGQTVAADRTPATGTASIGAPSGVEGAVAANDAPRYTQAAYESDFQAMDLEIRAMQTLLDQRRADLDPATIAVLEKSMKLIDQAIAESRDALLQDPASQFLAAQLARSYSTKLTLLRSTATMPVGD